MRQAVRATARHRQRYEPSPAHPKPYAMLAISVVCDDTDVGAERLAAPLRLAIIRTRTGQRAPIASIEEALAYEMSAEESAIADEFFRGAAIGSPGRVAERLRVLAHETGADELMLSTLVPDLGARTRALEHVAAAMVG